MLLLLADDRAKINGCQIFLFDGDSVEGIEVELFTSFISEGNPGSNAAIWRTRRTIVCCFGFFRV